MPTRITNPTRSTDIRATTKKSVERVVNCTCILYFQPSGETPATTPEDEDVSMSEGGPGRGSKVPASKPKTKVKPVEVEATTTEKEHVNVVFIGHVGQDFNQAFFGHFKKKNSRPKKLKPKTLKGNFQITQANNSKTQYFAN